ncbi:hypothetical protein CURE108131_24270 [Cupriavidus respiraculi]|uniref:Cupin 2 conserved barrel domain-containing protein n=1 Tax=Cupriavidus respiraculi TaxID=195930 RepID=A0ABN7YKL9_9BURK|nr:hypothetical protein LMG21510_02251 [Cupriavidus respiraculi]
MKPQGRSDKREICFYFSNMETHDVMQIFTRIEVPVHPSGSSGETLARIEPNVARIGARFTQDSGEPPEEQLDIGIRHRLVPASAGLGSTGDYIHLKAGETQPLIVAGHAQWWTCLRGLLEIVQEGEPPSRIGQGYTFAARRGERFGVTAVEETVLVRMTLVEGAPNAAAGARQGPAQKEGIERGAPAGAAFAKLAPGDDAWPARLRAHGMRWAVCCTGAARLQWGGRAKGRRRVACLQPGMAFAPGARQAYTIEPLDPTTGMLCFMQPRSAAQRRMYCEAPNSISRALSSCIGLRSLASTSTPRFTAGRSAIVSNQRFKFG